MVENFRMIVDFSARDGAAGNETGNFITGQTRQQLLLYKTLLFFILINNYQLSYLVR